MNISSMAVSNIKGNLYRYAMFFLSNSFAVTVFFIFANFILHPSIDPQMLPGGEIAHKGIVNGFIACMVIIVVFSFDFVRYSTSIFLKSRGKEFGLLSLFGMTKGQIRKYVFIESTIMSVLSIVSGIIAGTILSKLFFMIMEIFMEISIPFHLSIKAAIITVLVFFTVLELVNIVALFKIKSKEIARQLKISKIPKEIPKFSIIKSILGVALLAIGYLIAWNVHGAYVPVAMLPVIAIVSTATYFIFTQFSIAAINWIGSKPKFIYNKTNLIIFSQLRFKLRETAKVLFLASIIGAVTFTATGTVFSMYTEVASVAGLDTPQDIAIVRRGDNLRETKTIDLVINTLAENNIEIINQFDIKGIIVKIDDRSRETIAISSTSYNLAVNQKVDKPVEMNKGEVIYNYPYYSYDGFGNIDESVRMYSGDEMKLREEDNEKVFTVQREVHGGALTLPNVGYFDAVILHDDDFEYLWNTAAEGSMVGYTGFNISNWEKSYDTSMEIYNQLSAEEGIDFFSRAVPYRHLKSTLGLVLFIGFFIAFLFFIASGSIIYFKLFNEIKQDGLEYKMLMKIGTKDKEIKSIATKQIGIIFFLPFVMGMMHCFFALKSLSNMLVRNLYMNAFIVMVGYLICQLIYFIVIRSIYLKRIKGYIN